MFSKKRTNESTDSYLTKLTAIKEKIGQADAVVIGAGAGLSTAAGFTYSGERFDRYFSDFAANYHFSDMYSGGFYHYDTLEEYWAYWSRYIYVNRYMDAPTDLYDRLLALVKDKDYFVLTTNVDHCFQKAGFDKSRLFYTQGDYGLFQCSKPCHRGTYDNEETVKSKSGVLHRGRRTDGAGRHTDPVHRAHRTGAPMPEVRQTHEHESPGRQYFRAGRRVGCCGEAV